MSNYLCLKEKDRNMATSSDSALHWSTITQNMREAIPTLKTPIQAIHWAQVHANSGFNHRHDFSETLIRSKEILARELRPDFDVADCKVQETPLSLPETIGRYKNVLISDIYFWHWLAAERIAKWGQGANSVIEFGAGLGEAARMILESNVLPIRAYVIVDLPESLFFSGTYLEAHKFWNKFIQIQADRVSDYRLLADLQPAIAFSQGSFQEMSREQIALYMDWCFQNGVKRFWSLNYSKTDWPELKNWRVLYKDYAPALITCDSTVDQEIVLEAIR